MRYYIYKDFYRGEIVLFDVEIWGNSLSFETVEGLFSPQGPDNGTMAMLRNVVINPGSKVLDLGCGYGLVGIAAAKITGVDNVYMVDIDEKAVECARKNSVANGVSGVGIFLGDGVAACGVKDFDIILSNPPYHVDFSVPKLFIEEGYRHLSIGGKMVMVVKRLDWYKNKLSTVFGGVRVIEEDGYFILISEKRIGRRRL
jgi:16S rRNA (guanine1207-N2)-methyltransferase